MNGRTGEAVPFGRKDDGADLVETSFLMMGLLCAREYFDRESPEEARRPVADLDCSGKTSSGAGSRETGATCSIGIGARTTAGPWITRSAAGTNASSRTCSRPRRRVMPSSRAVYHRGFASGPGFRNRKSWYGIDLPLGMAYGGPLFFTHYSFCGLDPRGLKDRYADYWAQNVHHVRINRAHCIANPGKFVGYGESCWGLTASDDAWGYSAHAPDNDNGTISPTAALASLPYAPAEVMAVLRHFLKRHGKRLWRELGFVDAFCESQKLVRRHFSGHRPGADHRDDREPSDGSPVEALHGSAGGAGWATQARLLEPAPERSRAVTESLEQWLGREYRHAATAMLRSISARDIVKERAGLRADREAGRGLHRRFARARVLGSRSRLLLSLVPRLGDRHRRRAPALRSRTPRRGGAHALRRFRALQSVSEGARWARARRVAALAIEGAAGLRAVPARRRPCCWFPATPSTRTRA